MAFVVTSGYTDMVKVVDAFLQVLDVVTFKKGLGQSNTMKELRSILLVTAYCYWVVLYKASHATASVF